MHNKRNTKQYHDNRKKHSKHAVYSPNGCMLFILLLLLLLLPFSESNIVRYTQNIKQPAIRKIYQAFTEPIIHFSALIHTSTIKDTIRQHFLTSTGLAERPEWDIFFYTDTIDENFFNTEEEMISALSPDTVSEQLTSDTQTSKKNIRNETAEQRSIKKTKKAYDVIPYSTKHPLRLLLFGDSQMYYLASGMRRALGDNQAIEIEAISVHSSGFLRSDYYNWPKKLETVLHNKKNETAFDAAVLLLGMNDYQDIYITGRKLLKAGSPSWERFYRKKIQQHFNIVLRSIPTIYRLGLPHVRNKHYDKKLIYMDKIQKEIAQKFPDAVINLSFEEMTNGLGTGYIEAIQNDTGSWVHFMQDDGIHYSIPGSEYIMKQLLQHINEDFLFE